MRPPDFHLVVRRRVPEGSDQKPPFIRVGAAWTNASGSLSITLNDGVVLDWRMCETHRIALFPNAPPRERGAEPDGDGPF